jgi:hypothetical protein
MAIPAYNTGAVPLEFEFKGKVYKGECRPLTNTCREGVCFSLDIILNDEFIGTIRKEKSGWKMTGINDQQFVDMIGERIALWYE